MKNRKSRIYTWALAGSLAAIAGIVFYGMTRETAEVSAKAMRPMEEERYVLDERTAAEFQPALVEKFREESELVVSSVEASVSVELKKLGILNLDILNRTQTLTYKGTGSFFVDLSAMGEGNIRLDNEKKLVIIEIPHTKLAPVEIDPEKFEAGETKKGLLAFGDLKFTPGEYNDLEKEVRARLEQAVNTKENLQKADENAVSEMKKLYEPVVKMVDGDYGVGIEFLR